jgi:hypothetical protein
MLKPILDASGTNVLRLTSIYTGVGQLTMLVGGSVAGVLISLLNPWGAIWFDVVSFVLCAILVAALVRVPAAPEPEPTAREAAPGVAAPGGAPRVLPPGAPRRAALPAT